jgi:hypothetical protein
MATGISKNKWNEEHKIISRDNLDNVGLEYSIEYQGKSKIQDIVKDHQCAEYVTVFNSSNNILVFGDNYDVLKYLMYQRKLRGKITLILMQVKFLSLFEPLLNKVFAGFPDNE